ncbi:MAG TPA: SDR family oxidoreductase [Kofleriaceae bacterium]|jgi:NAD(P)-dependent dehydrogenase (short-subunit alcohol dehydrogenase family)
MSRLKNKVALITGGTSGIGLAAATLFVEEGARVFVSGSTEGSVAAARDVLARYGDSVTVIRSDAGDVAQIDSLVAEVARTAGGIDVLFLNAGIVAQQSIGDLTEESFDRMYRINVKGPYFALRAAIPHLRAGGSVILNGSVNSILGWPGSATYAGTKAALRALGQVAAAELVDKQIRVNVLSPGPTDSGIIDKGRSAEETAGIKDWLRAKIPMKRIADVGEQARVALFLASDDSSFMTGEELFVDGGLTRFHP